MGSRSNGSNGPSDATRLPRVAIIRTGAAPHDERGKPGDAPLPHTKELWYDLCVERKNRALVRRPTLFTHPGFGPYWAGIILSEIGTRGTFAANLYHVYALTDSTAQTGLIGLAQAIALLVLSPMGGAYADRLDRRKLLAYSQGLSLVVSAALALATALGTITAWQVILSVLLNTAAATFDRPARQALIPALVPRNELVNAFALINPSRELAILIGPALAGLLIAVAGPEAMYAVDAVSYAALVVILAVLKIPPVPMAAARATSVRRNIVEGFHYVRGRPLIIQLMGLDLSATLFGAYRVVLPALALDVLGVGPAGYGLLGAAPSAGALIGSALVMRLVRRTASGRVLLGSTAGYGVAVIALAFAPGFALALIAAGGLGFFDAMATTIRHAAVQIETPDPLRGRVTSIYQMASRGGPALGNLNIGWVAGALGPVGALALGGMVPILTALGVASAAPRIREYEVPETT